MTKRSRRAAPGGTTGGGTRPSGAAPSGSPQAGASQPGSTASATPRGGTGAGATGGSATTGPATGSSTSAGATTTSAHRGHVGRHGHVRRRGHVGRVGAPTTSAAATSTRPTSASTGAPPAAASASHRDQPIEHFRRDRDRPGSRRVREPANPQRDRVDLTDGNAARRPPSASGDARAVVHGAQPQPPDRHRDRRGRPARRGFVFVGANQPAFACSIQLDPASPGPSGSPVTGQSEPDMTRGHVAVGTQVTYTYCPPAQRQALQRRRPGPDPAALSTVRTTPPSPRAGSTTSSTAGS